MGKDWAWTTNTVSVFDGASGLLEAFLAFVLGTEVTEEALSGSGTSWSGTLAHSPVGLGRAILRYTISAVEYEITDDGNGNFVGTGITTGTITHATGAYSITFASTPTGTPEMDYLYGAIGRDWRLLMKQNSKEDDGVTDAHTVFTDPKECIIQNTGKTGTEDVILGFREWEYTALDYRGWDLNGYTVYNTGQHWNANSGQHSRSSYDDTYNHWDLHPMLPLIDDLMTYWIQSNRHRIIFIVDVQSNYESIYMGFGRRFSDKESYPYPLIIKGATYGNRQYSSEHESHLFCAGNNWSQYGYPLMVVDPSNNFTLNWGDGTPPPNYLDGARMLPYNSWVEATEGVIGRTPLNRLLMMPVYVTRPGSSYKEVYMDLDGCYLVAGTAVQSEDTLVGGGFRNMIFQNIHRTGNYDFMAIQFDTSTTTTTTTTHTTTSHTTTSYTTTTTTL